MTRDDLIDGGYIQLQNTWFKTEGKTNLLLKIGTDGFLLLNILLSNRTFDNKVFFNKQLITNIFGNKRTENTIIAYKALKNLVDNDILILETDVNYDYPKTEDLIIAQVNFPITFKENFFMLYRHHLNIIKNNNFNVNEGKLLSVYCSIRYKIYNDQYCKTDINHIVNETGINKKSIIKYIDVLQDLGLILYDNPGTRYFEDKDQYKEAPNFYVLNTEDAEYILSTAIKKYREEQEAKGVKFIKKGTIKLLINDRRINTCKQKRADYMFNNNQLEEDEYNSIVDKCEVRKEELAWKDDEQVDLSKLINYEEKDNPFADLDPNDIVNEDEFDIEKFLIE